VGAAQVQLESRDQVQKPAGNSSELTSISTIDAGNDRFSAGQEKFIGELS
jgi:hypothetical protein